MKRETPARGRAGRNPAGRSVPPRTDPLAAALAFTIREAVRIEAERLALNPAPGRATVSDVKKKPEATAA